MAKKRGHMADGGVNPDPVPSSGPLSRRRVLGGAGIAAAGGVALTTGASVLASTVSEAGSITPGTGRSGSTVAEFVAHIDQNGANFTAYGYFTLISGTQSSDLFSAADRTEATALFTAAASGTLVARSSDDVIHSLDIQGEFDVFQRSGPGASFSRPASFSEGTKVATYTLVLQDVLTVIDTNKGIPTLTGDMVQTDAQKLSGVLSKHNFGRKGIRLRIFATGLGVRTEATAPVASLKVAGNLTIA
jgi:hypothetical protein